MAPLRLPNSKMCFACGLENPVGLHLHFFETEPGTVEAAYTAPEHFQGYPGILHGGIAGALIDEVAARAHMGTNPRAPRFMYTARLELRYRKNVPVGQPLRVVGKAGRQRGRSAEAWGGIYLSSSGDLLAEGTALLVDVPRAQLEQTNLDELGWRVYPN